MNLRSFFMKNNSIKDDNIVKEISIDALITGYVNIDLYTIYYIIYVFLLMNLSNLIKEYRI